MDNLDNIDNIDNNKYLSYQQKYYIKNKIKIKNYQKIYYQNKKSNSRNYNLTITRGKFILFKD
tara:strand:- start:506 stop:694 length:189 start_codon:yes stop_codon:yes gene_type:complete